MIFETNIKQKIKIELSNEEIAEMSKQPCCDSLDLVDKILSTFTWHDSRSREGKIKILEILDKHKNIILKHLDQ